MQFTIKRFTKLRFDCNYFHFKSGSANWYIDDEMFKAEAGRVFHHPPGAAHRMTSTDKPFLALWMRTGALFGRYWFIGHEEKVQAGEQKGDGRGLWT